MIDKPRTKRILILSANPFSTSKLRLDEEVREIKEGLRRSKQRDLYSIETVEAVRYRDLHRAILDFEPNIIHFCGHGASEEGLVFEDEIAQPKLVDTEAIAGLFELFAEQVECVVLNACYSEPQAKAISQHINYVIGMNQAIGDKAAIEFAVGFYDALGAGKSVEFAYRLGCSSIRIAGILENSTPKLLKKNSFPSELPKLDEPSPQFEPTGGADIKPTSEAIELFNQAQDIKEVSKQQAIELLTQAINLSPNYYLAYYERGITYSEQRQYRLAIKDFDCAVNLYSDDYNLYFKRAIVHKTLGDEKRAIEDYEQVIELNPDEDKAYNNLGVIYAERGDYQKAIEYFKQGLEIAPMQSYRFLLNLAGAYIKYGKIQEAINTYDAFINQGHQDPSAYFYRGILYDRIREVEKAIQDLEEAYNLYANNKWSTEKALEAKYLIKEIKAFGHIRKRPYISLSTWL
jgi:tetratricopeptide (TPR) repeat protein